MAGFSRAPGIGDSEWTMKWLECAQKLHGAAIDNDDFEAVKSVHGFLAKVIQIRQLLNAFHRSPKRAISGSGSVSDQLELSKTSVHQRIHAVGLAIEDFRNPEARLDTLVFEKNKKMARVLEYLHDNLIKYKIDAPPQFWVENNTKNRKPPKKRTTFSSSR